MVHNRRIVVGICFRRIEKGKNMKYLSVKTTALSIASLAAFACASFSAQADACCGFFAALFGCGGCQSCCRPACAPCSPCGPSGCSTSTYYGPIVYSSYGCSSCDSPCGTGGCASGNCAVNVNGTSPAIAPDADPEFRQKKKNSGTPETYRNDGNRTGNDAGDGTSGQGGQNGNISLQNSTNGKGNDDKPKEKKSPNVPKADGDEKDDTTGIRRGPAIINLDDRIAWRSAPTRTRIGVRPPAATARLVRLPAYPKTEWQPIENEEKVAKK
jgi:hypothetical protein